MTQPTFFDGRSFVQARDGERLATQHTRILEAMQSGGWWTLRELSAATGAPEASVSARIRDLKKTRFGSHKIESQYVRRGLWQYRMAE
jgi:hypothetical protein